MNRQYWLVFVVICLIIVRLVILPFNNINDNRQERIESKILRVDKGQFILGSKNQIIYGLKQIDTHLVGLEGKFPKMKSVEQGQLDIQRRITGLARENSITIESAEWTSVSGSNPIKAQFEVQFNGKLNDLVKWHFDIEEVGGWISAESIQFSTSKQNLQVSRQGQAKGVVIVDALFAVYGDKNEN